MLASSPWRNPQKQQAGYVLLVLLLMCSLIVISLAVAAPSIAFSIKRDREQELIHRGVEYGRAIRVYYHRNGGYPTSLDQLQQREGVRYLRHAYTDPDRTGQSKC
jgi:type II secretory pathway pseudopilin PulG